MLGIRFLASLMDSPDGAAVFIRFRLTPELFRGEDETWAFQAVASHLSKYGTIPSRQTLKELKKEVTFPETTEPPAFYYEKVKERYLQGIIKNGLLTVQEQTNNNDPKAAMETLTNTVIQAQMVVHKNRLLNFGKDGLDLLWTDLVEKAKSPDYGIKLGWPKLDGMTGGLGAGDFVSLIGRPGQGKSFALLYAGHHIWSCQKKTVLFVSMEMKPLLIAQRLAALALKIPVGKLKDGELSTKQKEKLKTGMTNFQHPDHKNNFWVVDGALAVTATDILMLTRQLQPDVVVIDGAYMVKSDNPRLPRWERITDNAERLKGEVAEGVGLPLIASYQFNRGSVKKKKGESIGLEDIAGADAIGQVSSVVLGLLQEDNIENMMQKTMEILKGRSGETGQFKIKWVFDMPGNCMDFSEVPSDKEQVETLSYE